VDGRLVEVVTARATDLDGQTDAAWGDGEVLLPFWDVAKVGDDKSLTVRDFSCSGFVRGCRNSGNGGKGAPSRLLRLDATGQMVTGFGGDGVVTIGADGELLRGRVVDVNDVLPSDEGVIVAVSFASTWDGPTTHALLRLDNATGRLDPTFGRDGIVRVSLPVQSMTLDASGRLLALSGGTWTDRSATQRSAPVISRRWL
jgi:hypothetical protein